MPLWLLEDLGITIRPSLEDQQAAESEEIKTLSTKFILYDHIAKRVHEDRARTLLPQFKKDISQKIQENSMLEELFDIERLDNIFGSLYDQHKDSIEKHRQTLDYNLSITKDYYFTFDNLTWKCDITYQLCNANTKYGKVELTSVDVKLVNDAFIYTKRYQESGNIHQYERHKLKDWYMLDQKISSTKFPKIFDFVKNSIGITTTKPAFYYNYLGDRLDIQFKDMGKKLSFSVTFEYGSPTHDFDDYWEDI